MIDFLSWVCLLDISECASGTDNCDANAVCTNTHGNFTCTCRSDYAEDGEICTGKISILFPLPMPLEFAIQILESMSVPLVLPIAMPMLCVLILLGASLVRVNLVTMEME